MVRSSRWWRTRTLPARVNISVVSVRHQGGGHKQKYRIVDFLRDKDGVPGKVERIEYDPNRTAHLALVLYADGERRYIIAPKGVTAGDQLMSGPKRRSSLGGATACSCAIFRLGRRFIASNSSRAISLLAALAVPHSSRLAKAVYATIRLRSTGDAQSARRLPRHCW